MASAPTEVKVDRLSFAKVAATTFKPPKAMQAPSDAPNNLQQHNTPSIARDGVKPVTPFDPRIQSASGVKPKKLVQLAAERVRDGNADALKVHVQDVDIHANATEPAPMHDGLLAPTSTEDSGTQMSSSDGSGKPPSLDGKSTTSGTTFALDEKESLRPDDSASAKAVEDEDLFSPAGSIPPTSRIGSDDGARAFRDQLREIATIEPSAHRGAPTPGFNTASGGPRVLYVPPSHPGVGSVPGVQRASEVMAGDSVEFPPDGKLLEALASPRDRVWVLKLEQDIIDFVKDPKESALNLPQCNSFYRMLAHKIADYYLLGHLVDDSMSSVRLFKTPDCRLPPPLTGITAPSTASSTPPPPGPQMKILRRGAEGTGANGLSKSTSENGESGNDEDGRKGPVTREEREARYRAARLRIMGSDKPIENGEEDAKLKDDSRSSSAAAKKKPKKQRTNSEEGFEGRSAYTPYYTNTADKTLYPAIADSSTPQYASPSVMQGPESFAPSYGQMTPQDMNNNPWFAQGLPSTATGPAWPQMLQPGYDLSAGFQQAMSFQGPNMSEQTTMSPMGQYSSSFPQQPYGQQQAWPTPSYPVSYPPAESAFSPLTPSYGLSVRPSSSSSQTQPSQSYLYGQLPSQAYPGSAHSRNPEHPLPGSFNRQHFNPQSQAFVPGQASPNGVRPYAPQGMPSGNAPFGNAFQVPTLSRQSSSHSQPAAFGPPHPLPQNPGTPRFGNQGLVHQPVSQGVLQQPPASAQLPPKPQPSPQNPGHQQSAFGGMQSQASSQTGSTISKWAAPASLPAKPPPSAEPFAQRVPSFTNSAAAARVPNGGMPSFNGLPTAFGGGMRRV